MADKPPVSRPANASSTLGAEKYARLRAEAQAPYRGLRRFVYFACSASGAIGAFIFLIQLLAGRDVSHNFPNLALQLGIVALMITLFRLDRPAKGSDRP